MNISRTELKYLRSLKAKKVRDEEGKFLLEGWKPLGDVLKSNFSVEMIAVRKSEIGSPEHRDLFALAEKMRIPVKEMREADLGQVSDTVSSQGVVTLVRQKKSEMKIEELRKSHLLVACDRINDPGNLGTIVRTCDWFGVDAVIMNEGCVSLYNEKVLRSTSGSIFHIDVFENVMLEQVLPGFKSAGFKIMATAMEGKSIFTAVCPDKILLLLGNEAHGLDSALVKQADEVVTVPNFGKAESLNVGIACGIVLAELRKNRK
jgi:RNA methyltransferase, TrmH family